MKFFALIAGAYAHHEDNQHPKKLSHDRMLLRMFLPGNYLIASGLWMIIRGLIVEVELTQ